MERVKMSKSVIHYI